MKRRAPILALLLSLAGCDRAPPEPAVTVEDAVVILPVLPGRPGAAYFTLHANNDPTRLTGIASPRIGRIELHETVTESGVARMRPLRDAAFSPDAPLAFAAGARHAMLFDVDPGVQMGGAIPLTFTFDRAPSVTVEAEVRSAGEGHANH
jgi:copper(I)-binding protein